MARQTALTPLARIAKHKGQILKAAEPVMVLSRSGNQRSLPAHNSQTIVFRRWLPVGGSDTDSPLTGGRTAGQQRAHNINRWEVDPNNYQTTEGVTPHERNIQPHDITVNMRQYGILYAYTDQAKDFYEDDFLTPMRQRCGQTAGLIREKVAYGAVRGCLNKIYANGAARSAVNTAFNNGHLTMASQILAGNRADYVKPQIRNADAGNDISQIEMAYCVYCHTNLQQTIRALPGFVPVVSYGNMSPIMPREFGAYNDFRFIMSPELEAYAGAGAGSGSGIYETSGSADVYPIIVVAKDAWATVKLGGGGRGFDVRTVAVDMVSKDDPLSQVGYVGAKFYNAAFVENDGWMVVIESAAMLPTATT